MALMVHSTYKKGINAHKENKDMEHGIKPFISQVDDAKWMMSRRWGQVDEVIHAQKA